ncbi:uncharacterized protein TRIADDRAFT_55255 [Trichoplax adhaerens]|uniref:rhomboid protease n=1 Tax=Trichoplax adhaerens TaxID=10228 RepID=B3RUE1_TRIAD|nr:hypothetical protein TRIADDRAFT_55255 [Trichoplax adhaerens]EDV25796.1 hypothetical protein TRIADDRAFT_55255 [Trichoplax adhaerens]|eukprot:XP_002111829.1 hypothetical protein TRIADDRAFT_55255 [Trichoplax adhaerens]
MMINGLTTVTAISRGLPRLCIRNISTHNPFRLDAVRHQFRPGQLRRSTHDNADKFTDRYMHEKNRNASFRNLVTKPFIFSVAVCAVSFTGAIIAEYEKMRSLGIMGLSRIRGPFKDFFQDFTRYKNGEFRRKLNRWWNSLPDSRKVATTIIAINAGVFALWKIPKLFPFMVRWFTNNPASGRSITLLTSTFSHFDWWHLGMNMFVLWNFAPLACDILGKEQFFATYISAGVFASLGQNLYHLAIRSTRVFGLGASGALMGTLAVICLKRPDTQLSIIFLPFFSFPITHGMLAIMAIDVLGLLFRWRFLSHSAHLSGALFGGCTRIQL